MSELTAPNDILSRQRHSFENHLEQYLDNLDGTLSEPIKYLLKNGGKRIRPLLSVVAFEMFDGKSNDYAKLAMAIELFHNFTLMHDDIMDEADLRRGERTTHKKFGLSQAILSGDALLIHAYLLFDQITSPDRTEMLSRFNQMALDVCVGQQMDMDFEQQQSVSAEEYLEMIKLKTSVLLGCALELGGIMASAPKGEWKTLYDLGVSLGIAFQLKDDLLDAFGGEKTGKIQGGDILQNKKTLLMIHALSRAEGSTQEKLKHLSSETDKNKKIKETIEIFHELKTEEFVKGEMNKYFKLSEQRLNELSPPSHKKETLNAIINQLRKRDY